MKNRLLAGIAAFVLTIASSGLSSLPAAAADSGIALQIDQLSLSLEELEAMDYTVPVSVSITENPGFDAAEFGIRVDERCTFTVNAECFPYDNGFADSKDSIIWHTMANQDNWYNTGTILELEVTIPHDAQPGDIYEISYYPKYIKSHIWTSTITGRNYVLDDAISWTSGYIQINDSCLFREGRDNWSFQNSYSDFGSDSYYISQEHYDQLISTLTLKEKQKIDDTLTKKWNGACYGMAVTSVLAFHDILQPNRFQTGAEYLYDISAPPTSEVRSLIHYYYALQKTDMIQQMLANAVYNDTEQKKLEKLLRCLEDASPTLLTYMDYSWGGHAVVAHEVVYGEYTADGEAYDGKILLYDPNFAKESENSCLYFNTSDWSWCIPCYDLSSDDGAYLGIVTDDANILNYHGCLDGTKPQPAGEYISVLSSAPLNTEYTISRITETSQDAPKLSKQTTDTDIKAYASLNGAGQEHEVCFALPDADGSYALKLEKPDALDLSMDYEDSLLKVKASAGEKAVFSANGRVELLGNSTDYTLEMMFNESSGSWYSVTAEGCNADSAMLEQTAKGFVLSSENLQQVSISAKGTASQAVIGFSTEFDSVLLFEIDADTIGAAVDTDGDGTFERTIMTSDELVMGDVTLNAQASVVDVITLNQHILGADDLNTAQKLTADYDGDGILTAMDSLNIWKSLIGLE